MKISVYKLYELNFYFMCLIAVNVYLLENKYTLTKNSIVAIMVLIFSIIFIIKCYRSRALLIMSLCIFYFNYSVIVNDFLTTNQKVQSFMQYNNVYTYGKTLCILAVFWIVFLTFYKKNNLIKDYIFYKETKIVFVIPLFIALVLILIFGIDRSYTINYVVKITEIYEYSYLLFLFAFKYSGNEKWNKIFQGLLILFVVQDLYYGGRITSLQLILLLVIINLNNISLKKIFCLGFVGILGFSVVDMYRINYTFRGIGIQQIIEYFSSSRGALNTAYNSFYASVLHVVGKNMIEGVDRIQNLMGFLANLLGIHMTDYKPLGTYLRDVGLKNIGGGWYVTYFYFWLGWIGIIIGSLLLSFTFNYINNSAKNNKLSNLCLIVIIITVPRWYLYTPLALYRGIILTTFIHYFFKAVEGIKRKK